MRQSEIKLTEEALILDEYLGGYKDCIRRKKALEERWLRMRAELRDPIHGIDYSKMGTPKGGGGENLGSAALVLKMEEIEERLKEQAERTLNATAEIMEIIDTMEDNSGRRAIIERKYIDGMRWNEICLAENVSRSTARRHWKEGLCEMAGNPWVRDVVISRIKAEQSGNNGKTKINR